MNGKFDLRLYKYKNKNIPADAAISSEYVYIPRDIAASAGIALRLSAMAGRILLPFFTDFFYTNKNGNCSGNEKF